MSGMTPKEALAVLSATFRVENLTKSTIDIYCGKLADIRPTLLEAAIHRIVEHSTFFPSIAEIRRTAADVAGLLPPSADEAAAIARAADVSEVKGQRPDAAGDRQNYPYVERYWRFPRDLPPRTRDLICGAIEKAGDPVDDSGENLFGWLQMFKASYVRIAEQETSKILADLSVAMLPSERPRELKAAPVEPPLNGLPPTSEEQAAVRKMIDDLTSKLRWR